MVLPKAAIEFYVDLMQLGNMSINLISLNVKIDRYWRLVEGEKDHLL